MKLALAQINTRLGRPQDNLKKHLDSIEEAVSKDADLVVFPELSLTGYILQDLVPTVACRPTADDLLFAPLIEASQKIVTKET